MNQPHRRELELTQELLECARAYARKQASQLCPRHVDDAEQEALLHLISKPPIFDPSRGAKATTLIYSVIHHAILKFMRSERRHSKRATRLDGSLPRPDSDDDRVRSNEPAKDRRVDLQTKSATLEDVFDYIDNEESRDLCRLAMECGGNVSEVARRKGVVEGTIRYRLGHIRAKLKAVGFDPFPTEERSVHVDDD